MPRRISREMAEKIRNRASATSQRNIAKDLNVSRHAVANHLRPALPDSRQRPIEFKECLPYYCPDCNAEVSFRPCPACIGRAAQRAGLKSAAGTITVKPERRIRPSLGLGLEVPPVVTEWISRTLEKMIDDDGKPEEVSEAAECVGGNLFQLVSSLANTIGEQRRCESLQRRVAPTRP
jgi:hypothetical protein